MIFEKFIGALITLASMTMASHAEVLEIQNVTDRIYALVGTKAIESTDSLGTNATFGVVVTDQGVLLVDPGGSWQGAEALHNTIKTITEKPVKVVVNTGGKAQRWLGNGYWKAQGATIIAARAAVNDQEERAVSQIRQLTQRKGTTTGDAELVYANVTFKDRYELELGGLMIEIIHPGHAQTKGDSFVWLPSKETVFAGNIVYIDRILENDSQSNVKSWIEAFESIAALNPVYIVPGHGNVKTLEKATADTYDYLVNLRTQVKSVFKYDGNIDDAAWIDQLVFSYLEHFEHFAAKNAKATYEQMEWE